MILQVLPYVLGAVSGALVGLTLGLFGGGGSILAVPLMHYVVGVAQPHVAIGTSALAVAVSAATSLVSHARHGSVRWHCAALYSAAGILGALFGSSLGKLVDGEKLLSLFAVLMLLVGALMLRSRRNTGTQAAEWSRENVTTLLAYGGVTGLFSGFFGIGGGFLIVPGLIAATGMPMLNAIASSLVAVTAFGLATAFNYARSGLVDWSLAFVFVVGGLAGGMFGERLARRLASRKGALNVAFALLIFAVAGYMLWRSAAAFAGG